MTDLVSRVAELVGISPQACRRIAASAHKRYKRFQIPKRNGRGMRLVAQPSKEVKAVQRAIVRVLESSLPVHTAATAYKQGSSIAVNAAMHREAKFLTKLDFVDFFPSIDAATISHLLRTNLSLSDAEIDFVVSACLWISQGRRCLCIGAPSSPLLSNSVMFDFDSSASNICAELNVIYSRYSDDISISTLYPGVLAIAETSIRALCERSERPVLSVNEDKRLAVGRGAAMRVTGLTLANNGSVTVGRTRKRGVRAGASRFLRGLLDLDQIEALKGEIAFVLSVEPGFRDVLESSYGYRVLALLPRVD